MPFRTAILFIAALALCFGVGCFKSSTTQASSESSSKSSSSPFKSSSKSSGDEDEATEETAYQRDIRDSTARFALSQEDLPSFQRDLSAIAESYGVTDWERLDDTYVAIGRGLAVAEAPDERTRELVVAISDEDFRKLDLVRAGYEGRAVR